MRWDILARHKIDRNVGGFGDRRIAMFDQLRKVLHQVVGRDQELGMTRGELPRHQPGIVEL